MSKRKKTPHEIQTEVLIKSARRCALCFGLDGDLKEKEGQIAHLDRDPSNYSEENLIFLCLRHHSLYDSRTSQHKGYTIGELKAYRAKLKDKLKKRKSRLNKNSIENSEDIPRIRNHEPHLRYDSNIESLIELLVQIFKENKIQGISNLPAGQVSITEKEKEKLISLLEEALQNKYFIERSYFVDSLLTPKKFTLDALKKMYYAQRYSRTPPWARNHWEGLIGRLDIPGGRNHVAPMTFEQFLLLEASLFAATGLDKQTSAFLIQALLNSKSKVEDARTKPITRPSSRKTFEKIKNKIVKSSDGFVSRMDLGKVFVVSANLGALFTTRDWTTVGAISVLGGNLANTIKPTK